MGVMKGSMEKRYTPEYVEVKLTLEEAQEMLVHMINSYGDGEYYHGRRNSHGHGAYTRALASLREALGRYRASSEGFAVRTLQWEKVKK